MCTKFSTEISLSDLDKFHISFMLMLNDEIKNWNFKNTILTFKNPNKQIKLMIVFPKYCENRIAQYEQYRPG